MFYSSSDELVGRDWNQQRRHCCHISHTLAAWQKTIYTAVVQINGGRAQLIFGLRGLRNINFKLRDCGELWKYPVVFQDGTPGETTVNKGQIRGLVFK